MRLQGFDLEFLSRKMIIHCPLSIVHCPLSIVHCPLSIVHCPLSIGHHPLSIVNCPLSIINCPLSIVNCPLSIVNCPLSIVNCPLSIVNCQLNNLPFRRPAAPKIDTVADRSYHQGIVGPVPAAATFAAHPHKADKERKKYTTQVHWNAPLPLG
jgi:hypothetical protein